MHVTSRRWAPKLYRVYWTADEFAALKEGLVRHPPMPASCKPYAWDAIRNDPDLFHRFHPSRTTVDLKVWWSVASQWGCASLLLLFPRNRPLQPFPRLLGRAAGQVEELCASGVQASQLCSRTSAGVCAGPDGERASGAGGERRPTAARRRSPSQPRRLSGAEGCCPSLRVCPWQYRWS